MISLSNQLYQHAWRHIDAKRHARIQGEQEPLDAIVGPSVTLQASHDQNLGLSARVIACAPPMIGGTIQPYRFLENVLEAFGGENFHDISRHSGSEYESAPLASQVEQVFDYLQNPHPPSFLVSMADRSKVVVRTRDLPLSLRTEVSVLTETDKEYLHTLGTIQQYLAQAGFVLHDPSHKPGSLFSFRRMAQ